MKRLRTLVVPRSWIRWSLTCLIATAIVLLTLNFIRLSESVDSNRDSIERIEQVEDEGRAERRERAAAVADLAVDTCRKQATLVAKLRLILISARDFERNSSPARKAYFARQIASLPVVRCEVIPPAP